MELAIPMTDIVRLADTMVSPDCWTRREILQQPDTLHATQALVTRQASALADFLAPVLADRTARVVLTGAGTSAFIGDSIAPSLARMLDRCVEAIATTDIVSAPDLYLNPGAPLLMVSFGRSGNSPESIAAVNLANERVPDVRHLMITCNPDGTLARQRGHNSMVLTLPEETHDRGFAMTSSFSAMMLAALAALGDSSMSHERVTTIAAAVRAVTVSAEQKLTALAARSFSRVVYLGSGPFKGLAREAALKLLELSDGQLVSSFDTSLGFRHGPKAIVGMDTLVVVFISNHELTRRYDLDIIDEL